MRFLYLCLFETRAKATLLDGDTILDCCFLLIICALFVIGLRFWTAPVYLNYRRQINSAVAPLCLPVIFMASHWDIVFLGLLVLYMNAYVFWYHIDPPANIYQLSQHKFKDRWTKD